MDILSDTRPGGGRRRRQRRSTVTGLVLLATALLSANAAPGFGTAASAEPPDCEDGSPPPCDFPDPDPDPTTTAPTQPKPEVWFARVSVLDQSTMPVNRHLTGGWKRAGSPSYITPPSTVTWNDATKNVGRLSSTSMYLPGTGPVGFWLRELGAEHLCRSHTSPQPPTVSKNIHILAAPAEMTSAATITEMANKFVGVVTPTPDGADFVRIDSISLVPEEGQLRLEVRGYMEANIPNWPDDIDDNFVYRATLRPYPSGDVGPNSVFKIATLSFSVDVSDWGSDVESVVGPKLRKAVDDKLAGAMDAQVAATESVMWFASLGYTVSVRKVTTSPAGIEVEPSLCKVE